MSHLDERALGLYVLDPSLIRPRAAAHAAACEDCRQAADALREFEAALREPESWTGLSAAAPPATNDELREFAIRAEEEDAAALLLLDEFKEPSAAARFVWADIARDPEYQTGGVARLLCRWANAMCQRNPLYALKLAKTGTAIADSLPDSSYPRGTIHDLRGEARKEQTNALFSLGRFCDALFAAASAEAEFRKLQRPGIGLAAVTYIRGLVGYEQEDLLAAEQASYEAAEVALQFGATDLYLGAQYLRGYVLFDRHDYAAAAAVFEGILRYGEARQSVSWIARSSLAVGGCWLEVGRTRDANRYLQDALRLYTSINLATEVTRTHWMIARVIFAEGNRQEAIYRLRRCIREFTEFGMLTDAATVAVDVAEFLDATGRVREIPKVLANVVETFIDAGKLTSALAALAYLKDAATEQAITPHLLAYVRRFVQRSDRQPTLVFAPPPHPL